MIRWIRNPGLGSPQARSHKLDNKSFARIALWVLLAVVLFTVFRQFDVSTAPRSDTTSYTQ